MKNAFYFMFKDFFTEIFLFCPDFLAMQKNSLIRKLNLIREFNLKLYGVTDWAKINNIYIYICCQIFQEIEATKN